MAYSLGKIGRDWAQRGRYSITYDGKDSLGDVFMVRRDGRPWSRTTSEVLARCEVNRLLRAESSEKD